MNTPRLTKFGFTTLDSEQPMISVINSLSTGTQATLFNISRYDELEKAVQKWVDWVTCQHDGKWDCWQGCWNEYKTVSGV